jgi:hypothetical protein
MHTMVNPWLALDVVTNSTQRARELRVARDRFLEDGGAPAGVREPILDSWRRSAGHGMDPGLRAAPVDVSERVASSLLHDHPLGHVAPLVRESLGPVSVASDHLIALSDATGLLLAIDGDRRTRREAATRLGMVAGARFSEHAAGTNAIGVALATGEAVQVFAAEHFCEHSQWWTCAAAPIRDRASGTLLGAINLTAPMETVHPHTLALVAATAALIELSLLPATPARPAVRPAAREDAPRLDLASLGVDRAAARLDGEPVHLSLRHSELLVLLAAEPAGMTAEQLALKLYGETGKPVSARAEISRLRRLLPGCIDTDPYTLAAEPRTDFAEVRRQLRDGRVDAALAGYRGQLLPRSEAPGIAELRDELEGWTRRAVLASDDVETRWSWLETTSGREDLQVWKLFLAGLPPEDGRRGLAAARLARLRPLHAVAR